MKKLFKALINKIIVLINKIIVWKKVKSKTWSTEFEADEDYAAGRYRVYNSMADFIKDLPENPQGKKQDLV